MARRKRKKPPEPWPFVDRLTGLAWKMPGYVEPVCDCLGCQEARSRRGGLVSVIGFRLSPGKEEAQDD